jgi:hypothetical protein
MEETAVEQLKAGDKVFWNDPDDGLTSRTIKIQSISVRGEMVMITGVDGDYLECYAGELSYTGKE